ncbi:phosphoglycolate phosphatase [Segnochrobactrum spirostomi]|uniref:Phosphoglycolate phosphatase n=1 Tax=Segnochrobactrum spirostomi TaxID=2608987 RepID=A0A6A7XY19_9HYPH|nr:phosphoglycolate phosphatase [Segnochrobactrum spirostomi]MQT11238.1 phosphoglycolate phosphatase [Segnochrobactrum spirostomi]
MSRVIAFDLDGTLVETAPDLAATLNLVLAEEGLAPIDEAGVRSMVGRGARVLIARGLAARDHSVSEARLEELFQSYLVHYEARIDALSHPFPGVADSLDRFAEAGWTLAVCTNKPEKLSKLLLGKLGLADRFSVIAGPDTFGVSKPDPQHILRTVEAAGGTASHAVMVGDSHADVAAAKAAGVPVIGVTFGYTDQPVASFGPDRTIDHFDELWDAVATLRA